MKTPKADSPKKTRVRPITQHRSFKLTKKKLKQPKPIPTPWALLRQTMGLFRRHWRPLGSLVLTSLVLSFVFVQGFGSTLDAGEIKANLEELFGDETGTIGTSLALFSYMLGNASAASSQVAGAYQLFLTLIMSLATIWIVRQLLAKETPTAKDAFYKGMYPLVPFLLVLVVIGLQLLPMLLGNLLFSTVINNGLAITAIEKVIWALLFGLLTILSLYMVTSSLFALYIVTLPDMTPLRALRSARELVLHRRFSVWLRIITLPFALLILAAVLVIPMLVLSTVAAQAIFLLIGAGSLVIFHTYMYLLYRSLL